MGAVGFIAAADVGSGSRKIAGDSHGELPESAGKQLELLLFSIITAS